LLNAGIIFTVFLVCPAFRHCSKTENVVILEWISTCWNGNVQIIKIDEDAYHVTCMRTDASHLAVQHYLHCSHFESWHHQVLRTNNLFIKISFKKISNQELEVS